MRDLIQTLESLLFIEQARGEQNRLMMVLRLPLGFQEDDQPFQEAVRLILGRPDPSWKKIRRPRPVKTASGVIIERHRSGRTKVWHRRIKAPVSYPLMMGGA